MSKNKTILNNHLPFLLFAGFSLILRFSSNVPTLFVADSPKYFVPLQIIYEHNFGWLLSSINFSLLDRIINYLVQINHAGNVSSVITLHKLCGVASTLLIYWIIYKANPNYKVALVAAIIFSLNPGLLYIEQIVMPESFYVFFLLLTLKLIQEIFTNSTSTTVLIYTVAAGLVAGLSSITKQTSDLWIYMLCFTFFIYGLINFLKNKNLQFILVALIFYLSSYAVKLPFLIRNLNTHGVWAVTPNESTALGGGPLLWSLTEPMVYSRVATTYPWLTELIINTTEEFKKQFVVNDTGSVTSPFYLAISRISVAGREGKLINPHTSAPFSPGEWAKVYTKYFLELSISQPLQTLQRILRVSMVNMFAKEDLGLFLYENSIRPNVGFNPIQFTMVPFSLTNNVDPKLAHSEAQVIHIERNQLSKAHSFFSYFKMDPSDKYLVMVNMDTPYGFWYKIEGLSPWWQRLFAFTPWIWIIFPAFLIAFITYSWNLYKTRQFDIFELIVLISALYFAFFPVLITMCEPRYRLQFVHFMLMFIAITIAKLRKEKV